MGIFGADMAFSHPFQFKKVQRITIYVIKRKLILWYKTSLRMKIKHALAEISSQGWKH